MKNLKINIHLSNPVIMDRFLTIDSILLALHFNKLRREGKIDGFIDTEEYIKENRNNLFIDYKNGVLSGSIWYIEEDAEIWLDNTIFSKKIETKKIYELTGKTVRTASGAFKAARFGFETMIVPKIYFYVKGDKEYIESLLKDLKYIGKKASSGFGIIDKVTIEEIDKDKSYMLNNSTPSKPLPCDDWEVKSRKTAFYRPLPPYYDKKDIVPCFMPTKSLIERKDKTINNNNFHGLKNIDYISAAKFAREYSKFDEVEIFQKLSKKVKYLNDNTEHRCIICKSIEKEGLLGNPKNILPTTFNDYAFLDKGDFLCLDCLWSMKQERVLGNTFISEDKVFYLQGGKMEIKGAKEQQRFRDEFFRNMDLLKPPFLISFKSTANTQHTVFKNKVAISNAMIPVSFGTEEHILIDVELLKEAIKDMEKILKKYKCIKKLHLVNFEKISDTFPRLSKNCGEEERKALQNFWKKYDRSVRKILNRVMF